MGTETIPRWRDYTQVCIWPGTQVVSGPGQTSKDIAEFINWVKSEFGTRAQYLEEIYHDDVCYLLFAVHCSDIGKFAIPRLDFGIRWIEDATDGGNGPALPHRLREYRN